MRLLMCKPKYYQVEYDINPWMADNAWNVNRELAMKQWTRLYETLRAYAHVELIEQHFSLPDMVFTANAGVVRGGDRVLLSNFNTEERSPEEWWFQNWFEKNGYVTIHQTNYAFEGSGDFLSNPNKTENYFGHGFRSNSLAGNYFKTLDHSITFTSVKLTDRRFYHLDTCFCPLDHDKILCYPAAIDGVSLEFISRRKQIIPVSEEEAKKFACNAIVIGKDIFMPECWETANTLSKLGFTPHLFEMSEFIKAGGACRCLVMEI